MMRLSAVGLTALLLSSSSSVRADEPPNRYDRINIFGLHYSLLVGGTAFSAQTRASREAFGRTHLLPDVRLAAFGSGRGLHFAWDASGRRMPGDSGQSARFFTASVGGRLVMARPSAGVVPYVVLRGGPYFARTGPDGTHTVAGGNAEVGLSVDHRLVFAGRYDLLGHVNGFDLSGYSVRVSFKVY